MINLAQVLGRVGKIETKTLPSGTILTNLSMVTSKKITKNGQKEDKATWHNIVCFSKLSEIAEKYVAVGDLLYIAGEMDNQKYTGQDGIERTKASIIASELKLMPRQKAEAKPTQKPANHADEPFVDSDIPW